MVSPADGYEALLPNGELEFTLKLASPVSDATAVEVDFVHRRPVTGTSAGERGA